MPIGVIHRWKNVRYMSSTGLTRGLLVWPFVEESSVVPTGTVIRFFPCPPGAATEAIGRGPALLEPDLLLVLDDDVPHWLEVAMETRLRVQRAERPLPGGTFRVEGLDTLVWRQPSGLDLRVVFDDATYAIHAVHEKGVRAELRRSGQRAFYRPDLLYVRDMRRTIVEEAIEAAVADGIWKYGVLEGEEPSAQ